MGKVGPTLLQEVQEVAPALLRDVLPGLAVHPVHRHQHPLVLAPAPVARVLLLEEKETEEKKEKEEEGALHYPNSYIVNINKTPSRVKISCHYG